MSEQKETKVTKKAKPGPADLSRGPYDKPTASTNCEERTYHQRNVAGRDGSGPCTVLDRGAVMLPNGDIAVTNDTFDPVMEGMSPPRLNQLINGKHIVADKGVEDKLMKDWVKKTDATKKRDGDDGGDG